MSKATSIALVASALFLLPCASDDGVVRRYVMTVDGRDVRVVEGEDAVIPCTHAEGKQHTIRVIQAPTFLYRSQSFTFEFDAAMQLIVDRDDDAPLALERRARGRDGKRVADALAVGVIRVEDENVADLQHTGRTGRRSRTAARSGVDRGRRVPNLSDVGRREVAAH